MADIYGQLVKAQLENLAADPTGVTGLTYFHTGNSRPRYYDSAAWREIVSLDGTETLTNKTLTSPSIATPVLTEFSEHVYDTTPANPAAGRVRLYYKSDNLLYQLTSGGVESAVGGSSPAATASTAGIVTSYAPTVASRTKTTAGSHTIANDDGYDIYAQTASGPVTLPSAASNIGKVLRIVKAFATGGSVNYVLNGADAIAPAYPTTYINLEAEGEFIELAALAAGTWTIVGSNLGGKYTPTATVVQGGASSITIHPITYSVNGFVITCSGSWHANGDTFGEADAFTIPVPIDPPANFTQTYQVYGLAFGDENNSSSPYMVSATAVTGAKAVRFQGRGAQVSAGADFPFTFSYSIAP